MQVCRNPGRWRCVLSIGVLAATACLPADRGFEITPASTHLPASGTKFVQFHFVSRIGNAGQGSEPVTAAFQSNGATPDTDTSGSCRIQFAPDGSVTLSGAKIQNGKRRLAQTNGQCTISPSAKALVRADGTLEATIPISFKKTGHYKLYARTVSTGWTSLADYQVDTDATAALGIQLLGVTPTQVVLDFTPPPNSTSCQVQVTATQTGGFFDYTILVPDTDPAIFPGADNANPFDPVNSPQNRGFQQPDGSLAIVIGKRDAEYSPNTYKMHSRALQAATPHEAWISCGSSSGVIDFTTANIMTGISYSDPLPADPNRPGWYAYPTISWSNRQEGAVDPQTGIMIHPISLPTDGIESPDFSPWTGNFGSPIQVSGTSLYLPANINNAVPSWLGFVIDQNHPGWSLTDYSLLSFLPSSIQIGCPECGNTPVTVCLTADGISCAYDRNVTADPNATPDPNSNISGILGITLNCSGNCSFPNNDPRWSDPSPVLSAWHPNYTSGAPLTVVPSFQFDSVKIRSTPVQCSNSAMVYRAGGSSPIGAPFNPLWKSGTPVLIDSARYTIKQVIDENTVLLNQSCPASAQTMTANTFGLLISSPVPLSGVVPGPWTATFEQSQTNWDAAGDLNTFTNCSRQPVMAGGVSGWHCTIGTEAYWIAADGSSALPLGTTGVPYRPDLGNSSVCIAAFWDDLDGNTMNCVVNAANAYGKHVVVQMTFNGDHSGLETAQFTSPEIGGSHSYLPVCQSTNPATPNNCWNITPLNQTGTNSLLIIEDAVKAAAPDAWNNSAFPAAIAAGAVYSYLNSKLDDSHLMVTTWLQQNSYAFSSILEFSTPRGTAQIRAVLPSWTPAPDTPAGSATMRWAGIHNPGGDPWGVTKTGYFPTYFRGGGGPGEGPFYSNILSTAPTLCPFGVIGICTFVTIDGQPGDPVPSQYDPINDAKTNKPGFGYLQDLAPGDLLCAPLNGDFADFCINYIANGRFEDLRVLAASTESNGQVVLTVLRNVGNTLSMPLVAGQQLYTMPSSCDYSAGYGCQLEAVVWDWSTGSVEQVVIGGEGHQFTNYDPVGQQVVSAAGVSDNDHDPHCYSSSTAFYPNCYSLFTGPLDSTQTISSQAASFSQSLITQDPPFAVTIISNGLTGEGTPNDVDSHPGVSQMAAAPASEKIWFVDGRPFDGFYTAPLAAPVSVTPNVYRFPSPDLTGQSVVETYKRLPVMASCGTSVLKDVMAISDQTPYSFCVAINAGDCTPSSSPGDSFVSCPTVNPLAKQSNSCPFAGIGGYTPDVRDTCLTTAGPYAMGLTQTGFASQSNGIWTALSSDQLLRSSRLLTHGFSNYRIVDEYWNPKTTPDGGVLLFRAAFLNGYSTQMLMARIPPFPDVTQDPLDRRSFIPTPVFIDLAPDGTSSVKVQFGYNPSFQCTSRGEPCEARADFDPTGIATPFYFASENGPAGLLCLLGCPAGISLPGISQRVIYYQSVFQVNGSPVTGATRVTVVPDPTANSGSSN